MTTLTITEAKKNLGKWLNAATRGEQVGIINGATVISLQPVQVHAVGPLEIREFNYEYASSEYGVTKEEFKGFLKRVEREARAAERDGITIENPTFEKIEKAI